MLYFEWGWTPSSLKTSEEDASEVFKNGLKNIEDIKKFVSGTLTVDLSNCTLLEKKKRDVFCNVKLHSKRVKRLNYTRNE